MQAYARLGRSFFRSAGESGTTATEERVERAERLAHTTYQDLLGERLAYGTPQAVTERLAQWRDRLGLTGVIIESNVGGRIPPERVSTSIRLFAQEVAPPLR